jgi:hypothetical protein
MNNEELYDKILVFHDVLKNPREFVDNISINSNYVNEWQDWYHLGSQTLFTSYPNVKFPSFPSLDEWNKKMGDTENPLVNEVSSIFYKCTNEYVSKYSVQMPNWVHYSPYILSHASKKMDRTLAMQYHTDFIMSQADNPGYKFWVTCLLYLNDDYEGGEIAFKIFKNENEVTDDDTFDHFKYKPRAGDMLILPAHHPYYHGVLKTTTNKKLFIRMFWGYDYEGSSQWLENQKTYGAVEWDKIEKDRLDKEFKSSKWMKGTVEEETGIMEEGF